MSPVHRGIRRWVLLSLRRIRFYRRQPTMQGAKRSHPDGTSKLKFFDLAKSFQVVRHAQELEQTGRGAQTPLRPGWSNSVACTAF